MSKKHYNALAQAYAQYRDGLITEQVTGTSFAANMLQRQRLSAKLDTFDAMVSVTAGVMADDNDRFDRDRFLQAVYGEVVVRTAPRVTPHAGTQE